MASNMVKWIKCSIQEYMGLIEKNPNALYFIEDTQEIYKGNKSFTQSYVMVDELPEFPSMGKIYIKRTDMSGWIHIFPKVDNVNARPVMSKWECVIAPIVNELTAETQTGTASAEAVKSYVQAEFAKTVNGKFVEGISYDKATKDLKYTKNGAEVVVPIDGFFTGATYSGETGVLSFQVEGGNAININIPKDNFVHGGHYDSETQEIVLELVQGGEVKIPAADLVDVYTVGDTNSVDLTLTGNNITADVKVSATEGNALSVKTDGLYVEHTDVTAKADKVATGKTGEILVATADGNMSASGVKAGGATLADTVDDKTLATEKAVNAIKTALEGNLSDKLAKANIVTTIASDIATASDDKVLSEKAVLNALKSIDDKKINTESISTSVDPENASAKKVVSETALVASLSWSVVE